MVCKNCGFKIKGTPHKCPLCDKVFGETPKQEKVKKGDSVYKNPFTLVYIVTVLAVFTIVGIIGKFLNWDKSIWLSCFVSFLFLFYVIRHTILGIRNQASKLTNLVFVISIFMVLLFEISGYIKGYYTFFVANHAFIFMAFCVLIFGNFKVYKPHIVGFILFALTSWIPFFASIGRVLYIPQLVLALVETITAIVVCSIFPKEILNQIKRYFVR